MIHEKKLGLGSATWRAETGSDETEGFQAKLSINAAIWKEDSVVSVLMIMDIVVRHTGFPGITREKSYTET